MTTATLAFHPHASRGLHRRNLPTRWHPAAVAVGIALLLAAVLYLVQVNGLATKGYVVEDLERSTGELADRNRRLETVVQQRQSFRQVSGRVSELGMVNPQRVEYVSAESGVAVVR